MTNKKNTPQTAGTECEGMIVPLENNKRMINLLTFAQQILLKRF